MRSDRSSGDTAADFIAKALSASPLAEPLSLLAKSASPRALARAWSSAQRGAGRYHWGVSLRNRPARASAPWLFTMRIDPATRDVSGAAAICVNRELTARPLLPSGLPALLRRAAWRLVVKHVYSLRRIGS